MEMLRSIMVNVKQLSIAALAGLMLFSSISPAAIASNSQKHKNMWRNVAIGAGAVGLLALRHNPVLGVVGIAGAAYAAHRYEQDRHHQAVRSAHRQWYYRHHHRY
jgi:hypothetical protein